MITLLQFTFWSSVFYIFYKLFLSPLSFYKWNRYIILSFPLLCLSILFLSPLFTPVVETIKTINLEPIRVTSSTSLEKIENSISFFDPSYLVALYLIISSFILLLLSKNLIQTIRIGRKAIKTNIEGIVIYHGQAIESPFVLFNRIYIPSNLMNNKEQLGPILVHELVHKNQKHNYDLIFYKLLISIFWFNPFLIFLAKELNKIHEALADKEASSNSDIETYINLLLSLKFKVNFMAATNPFFNSSLIKTRINMLYKKQSNTAYKLFYTGLLAIWGLMIISSCGKSNDIANSGSQEKVVTGYETKDKKVEGFARFDELTSFPKGPECNTFGPIADQHDCFLRVIQNNVLSKIEYSDEAQKLGLEGKIFVAFTIDKKGEVKDAEVSRSFDKTEASKEELALIAKLEQQAVEVIESLRFTAPAKIDDKDVAIRFNLPISYMLAC